MERQIFPHILEKFCQRITPRHVELQNQSQGENKGHSEERQGGSIMESTNDKVGSGDVVPGEVQGK